VRRWAADRAPAGVRAVTYRELGDVYARRGMPAKAADAYAISQELEHRRRDDRAPTPERVEALDPGRSQEHPTARQGPLGDHEAPSLAGRDPMTAARPVLAPDARAVLAAPVWDATRTDIGAAALARSAGPMPGPIAEPPARAGGEAVTGLDAGLAAVWRVRGARTPSLQPVTFGR